MKKFEDYNFVVIDTKVRRDKKSPEAEELLDTYSKLDEDSKAVALELAKKMAEENKKPYC